MKSYQSLDIIDEYLALYMYKCNHYVQEKYSFKRTYERFLSDIARVCPPQGMEAIVEREIIDPQLKDGFMDDAENPSIEDEEPFYDETELMDKLQFDRYTRRQLEKELEDCLSSSVESEPIRKGDKEKETFVKNWIREKRTIVYDELTRVTSNTIETLIFQGNDGWLNDDAINAYLSLICKAYSKPERRVAYVNGDFFGYLQRKQEYPLEFSEDALVEAQVILVPIHEENHWFLAVVNRESKEYVIFDSIANKRHRNELNVIRAYMERLNSSRGLPRLDEYVHRFSLSSNVVPQQTNGSDCGVFALLFARIIASGGKISKGSINPSNIMAHRISIAYDIIKQVIH